MSIDWTKPLEWTSAESRALYSRPVLVGKPYPDRHKAGLTWARLDYTNLDGSYSMGAKYMGAKYNSDTEALRNVVPSIEQLQADLNAATAVRERAFDALRDAREADRKEKLAEEREAARKRAIDNSALYLEFKMLATEVNTRVKDIMAKSELEDKFKQALPRPTLMQYDAATDNFKQIVGYDPAFATGAAARSNAKIESVVLPPAGIYEPYLPSLNAWGSCIDFDTFKSGFDIKFTTVPPESIKIFDGRGSATVTVTAPALPPGYEMRIDWVDKVATLTKRPVRS